MKIVAAVNYFDEPLAHTDRLLRSLIGFVDEVVLLDGAYVRFPHDQPFTDPARLDEIVDEGLLCRVPVHVRSGPHAWINQTAKRSVLYNMAAERGDYFLVIDADEWIDHDATDFEKLRYKLNRHQPDAVCACLDTPANRATTRISLGTQSPSQSTSVHGKGIERLYRSATDIIVGPQHHGSISGVNEQGLRVALRKRRTENVGLEEPVRLDAKDYFRIVNGTWDRSPDRLSKKEVYGRARRHAREDS